MAEQTLNRTPQKLPSETLILVMGILSTVTVFCCAPLNVIFGIIGWVKGNTATKMYEQDPEAYLASSMSNVKIGKILSIIGIILTILFIAYYAYMYSTNPDFIQDMIQSYLPDLEQAGEAGGE